MAYEILLGLVVLAVLGIAYWLHKRSRFVRVRTPPRVRANQDAQSRYEETYRPNARWAPRTTKSHERLEGSWITVKFSNYCLKCSKLITEGERALWKEGVGIWHGNCQKHKSQNRQSRTSFDDEPSDGIVDREWYNSMQEEARKRTG